MSTHRLDVSGSRPLTTTLNDPAVTIASTSAKAGDDVQVTLGGLREIRLAVLDTARIERRRYMRRTQRQENGKAVKDAAGEFLYDEVPYEQLVLVLTGSASIFGRTSLDDAEKARIEAEGPDGRIAYEGTPHTLVVAKRLERHFTESGELLESRELREFLPALDAETLAQIELHGLDREA